MDFPFKSINGFPGKRDEAYLAGIMPIIFILYRFSNSKLLTLNVQRKTNKVIHKKTVNFSADGLPYFHIELVEML